MLVNEAHLLRQQSGSPGSTSWTPVMPPMTRCYADRVSHIEDLYRQVWLHPDDDQLRLVLADALLAAGDPRGELIQMQLHPDVDYARRAMRLLQQHGLTWLGRLRGAVIPLAYERGFLASCLVVDAREVLDCDEWSTVHTIELQDGVEAFTLRPVMRSLRRLVDVTPPVLLRIAREAPAQLATVAIEAEFSPELLEALEWQLREDVALAITVREVSAEHGGALQRLAHRRAAMKLTIRP
jgi:uncharacterized protein (TIGR02996 family)